MFQVAAVHGFKDAGALDRVDVEVALTGTRVHDVRVRWIEGH